MRAYGAYFAQCALVYVLGVLRGPIQWHLDAHGACVRLLGLVDALTKPCVDNLPPDVEPVMDVVDHTAAVVRHLRRQSCMQT